MSNNRSLLKTKFLKKDQVFGAWKLVINLDKGKGGNGLVWKVKNTLDNSVCAIKFLQPRHLSNSSRVERFRSEVQSMIDCNDLDGVLPIIDQNLPGKPSLKNPLWFVSELAIPLLEHLKTNNEFREIINCCHQYSITLREMHARKIYHRDIKPDNLFFFNNRYMIGDFGLADYPNKPQITKKHEKLGPLYYMAPEMISSAKSSNGAPADVWSLAKTLWKLGSDQFYPIEGTLRQDISSLRISTYNSDERAFKLNPILEAATNIEPEKRISMTEFSLELETLLESFSNSSSIINSNTNMDEIKKRVSNMWLKARKENQEEKVVLEKKRILKVKIDTIVKNIREEIISTIYNLISDTGLANHLNTNLNANSMISLINDSRFPKLTSSTYQNAALSIVHPPVKSSDKILSLLYGVVISVDENHNSSVLYGFWKREISSGLGLGDTTDYSTNFFQAKLNGPIFTESLKNIDVFMKNNLSKVLDEFLDEIKDFDKLI